VSLDTGRYQLYSTFKTLKERWDDTEEHWDDAVRREFGEKYWETTAQRVRAALSAIDRLTQVMVRARHDCSNTRPDD
jgi:hypothetical protein